jgi:hypothetical protein
MAGDGLRLNLLVERLAKDRHVDVTQPLDLHLRYPLVDQCLLQFGDLPRAHVSQQRGELTFDFLDGFALVQLPDQSP